MKVNWDLHIKQWQTESISQAEYCRREGLNYWSFRDHRKKREQSPTKQPEPTKIRTMIFNKPESNETVSEWTFEIGFKGYSVKIGKAFRLSDLDSLLGLLESRRKCL